MNYGFRRGRERYHSSGRYQPEKISPEELNQQLAEMEAGAQEERKMRHASILWAVLTREEKEPRSAGTAQTHYHGMQPHPETGEENHHWSVFFEEEDPNQRSVERTEELLGEDKNVTWFEERPGGDMSF